MMSHHFFTQKCMTNTIQPFSESKKLNKIKSKFWGVKMCPFSCYLSNGWTWKFKNYHKRHCPPPSLNNPTPQPNLPNHWVVKWVFSKKLQMLIFGFKTTFSNFEPYVTQKNYFQNKKYFIIWCRTIFCFLKRLPKRSNYFQNSKNKRK